MPATPLVEFLKEKLKRFGSKVEFARACGLAESQVHRLMAGEKPGVLVTLKVARCLGENPVGLLRLAGSDEVADLLACFVPEDCRSAGFPTEQARMLSDRVVKLAMRGLGDRVGEAVTALETPWQIARPNFEGVVKECGAPKAVLALSHPGAEWDAVFTQGCSQAEAEALREGLPEGWREATNQLRELTVRLFLFQPKRMEAPRVDVYLSVCSATFAALLR